MRIVHLFPALFPAALSAQTLVITFEATLNGSPTSLDSILVMNLTQGGDTTIHFPDNTLVLGTTGLNEQTDAAPVLAALPNPFETSTEVHVITASMGDLFLLVHDASCREVASLQTSGAPGVHRFRFTAPAHGVYLMSVTQEGQRRVQRLVATEGSGNVADLRYIGADAMRGGSKSDRSAFLWEPGDELRYIGYATNGGPALISVIDDVPTASVTHIFEFNMGVPCLAAPTITDIDNNVYSTVQIGNQCWMASNLRTSKYNDGTIISNVTNNASWAQLNTGAWCNYNNSSVNDATYGKLYNWYAAADPRICPQGWHVPTEIEWQQLEAALGMPIGEVGQGGIHGSSENVGGKMKATSLWNTPNSGATNESGFSGLPGGSRGGLGGNFDNLNSHGFWWSVSESGNMGAWGRALISSDAGILKSGFAARSGFCLRCIRD